MTKGEKLESLQIMAEGRRYQTHLNTKYKNRKVWAKPDPQEILSIIPGTVTQICVKEGEKVERGTQLMVYEAMKMQNIISAPFAGVVESISVREGEKLPKGIVMIFLRSSEEIPQEPESDSTANVLDLI